jgi:hypothetical protein
VLGASQAAIVQELTQFVRCAANLSAFLTKALQEYVSDKGDLDYLFGVIAAVGGWSCQKDTGTQVEVNINEQWYRGTVVDSGLGKRCLTVILDSDSLTLHKVMHRQVRTYL